MEYKEVVINLPKYVVGLCCEDNVTAPVDIATLIHAVKDGTPLPEGHGELIDIGKCNRELFYQQCGGANSLITTKTAFDMLLSLPTSIKAERGGINNDIYR